MSKSPPPQRTLNFLRWFCREDYLEEIEGNLLELYEQQYNQSPTQARRIFRWNVLLHFRPAFIRSFRPYYPSNHTAMFRHNFLMTFRNFQRYKTTFFINLIGLSSGLACALLIFLWVQDELSVDKFHENDAQLYQIMEHVDQATGMITRQTTAGPTGEALANDFPEVEATVTGFTEYISSQTLSVNTLDIKAESLIASAKFFELFSYNLLQGSASQVLDDKQSIVLSKDAASRLFGTIEDVVGQTVALNHDKQYQVSGIMENVPTISSVDFDFVIPFEGFRDENEWVTNWFNTAPQTFILLKEGTNIEQFNRKIADLVKGKTNNEVDHRTPFATRFSDAYLHNQYENGVPSGGRITYVRMFSVIAGFILLIACINFMNLATARATRRMKEVGIKKAIGARRSGLIYQYLSESLLLVSCSLLVALLLIYSLLPHFNDIAQKQITLDFDATLIAALLIVVLVTGVVAGSYPALYLSGFNPATVLKGKLSQITSEVWLRKGLVVFQFTLSITLMVAVWVVYQQIVFVQTQNLGYEKDNILLLDREGTVQDSAQLITFFAEARQILGVIEVSGSEHDMTGHNGGTYGVQWPGKDPDDKTEFERVASDYGLIEMLGIAMKEGRTFSEAYGTEDTKIIFNEAAIDFMGLTDPIGKTVQLWGEEKEIIGVTENFHFDSFHEAVKPLFFRYAPQSARTIMLKIEAGREQEAIAQLQAFYKSFNPGFPFDYRFLDQDYQALYTSEQRVSTLSRYFAGIAILISCLGLFGLAAFTAERRLKEIGIRKALGASDFSIVRLLSGDFTKMVLVAIVIALPLSYLAAQRWLQDFAFHIELRWWYFAGAGLLALLIAWFTVGLQTVRAARVNPVECLKDE